MASRQYGKCITGDNMENFVNLIVSNGLATVIVAYFLYKDYKQTAQIINVLGEIKEVLSVVKNFLSPYDVGR